MLATRQRDVRQIQKDFWARKKAQAEELLRLDPNAYAPGEL